MTKPAKGFKDFKVIGDFKVLKVFRDLRERYFNLLLLQQVANLGEQFLFSTWFGSRSFCCFFFFLAGESGDALHHEEDTEGDDEEIDYVLDERAILEHSSAFAFAYLES